MPGLAELEKGVAVSKQPVSNRHLGSKMIGTAGPKGIPALSPLVLQFFRQLVAQGSCLPPSLVEIPDR